MKRLIFAIFGGPHVHGHRTLSPVKLGVGFVVVVALVFTAAFSKDAISAFFRSGETITVHFAEDYKLSPNISQVKIAYVPIGVVTGVEQQEDNSAIVSVKIDDEALAALGSTPSAVIRATTVLGGRYFVDLVPGGDKTGFPEGGEIPLERATVAVELDKLVRALQPEALEGTQAFFERFDDTLRGGGTDALKRLVAAAPAGLEPGARVLDAFRGKNPTTDLTALVDGFENTGRVLTEREGQLDSIVADLATTSQVLGNRGADFGQTIANFPETLENTRKGLARLDGTLDTIIDTADDARPIVRKLDKLIDVLGPVLDEGRPVIDDLREVVEDLRPLVEDLVPSSSTAADIFNDLREPVLPRVNGPFKDLLYANYQGEGPFKETFSDVPVYIDLVHVFSNLHRVSTLADDNGHTVNFQPGFNSGTVGVGAATGTEQFLEKLFKPFQPETPQNVADPLNRPPNSEEALPLPDPQADELPQFPADQAPAAPSPIGGGN